MRTTTTATAVLVAGVCATLVAGPAHAAGPGPSCGATLTQDTVLAADLTCAAGDGLVLSPGVTLDLGGHALTGHGRSAGSGVVAPAQGVVTVTNGVVRGWHRGITAHEDPGAPAPEGLGGTLYVDRVVVEDTTYGIRARGRVDGQHKRVVVDRSTIRGDGNGTGILVHHGTVDARRSTVQRHAVGIQAGESRVTLSRSVVRDNGTGAATEQTRLEITSSSLVGNRFGVYTSYADDLFVSHSELLHNGRGLFLAASDGTARVQDTTFARNDVGIDQTGNLALVRRVTFRENGTGYRVAAGTWAGPWQQMSEVVDSTFTDGGDGLVSAQDGLRVGGNGASGNSGRGIHAPGATDLGGNTASGNGTEPQCVGVSCTPGG